MSARLIPPRPLLSTTIIPAPISSAKPTISWAGPPSPRCARATVPPREPIFSTSVSSSSLACRSELLDQRLLRLGLAEGGAFRIDGVPRHDAEDVYHVQLGDGPGGQLGSNPAGQFGLRGTIGRQQDLGGEDAHLVLSSLLA